MVEEALFAVSIGEETLFAVSMVEEALFAVSIGEETLFAVSLVEEADFASTKPTAHNSAAKLARNLFIKPPIQKMPFTYGTSFFNIL